jgi:hypothetical protein
LALSGVSGPTPFNIRELNEFEGEEMVSESKERLWGKLRAVLESMVRVFVPPVLNVTIWFVAGRIPRDQ